MRYYLDTEFDEKKAELISIGLVAQDGREFYAVNESYDHARMPDWQKEHVAPLLFEVVPKHSDQLWGRIIRGTDQAVALALVDFVRENGDFDEPEFWGYKCGWDIVLTHRLFGGYNEIFTSQYPIPLVCHDLVQLGKSVGINSIKEKVPAFEPAHNALVDARWTKFVHEMFIVQYGRHV